MFRLHSQKKVLNFRVMYISPRTDEPLKGFSNTLNHESVEKVPWPLRFLPENGPIKRVTKGFSTPSPPRFDYPITL